MFGPGVEATFVPGDTGRDSHLALWPARTRDAAATTLELVLPAGRQFRRRSVAVRLVPVAEALDALVATPADADLTLSVRAWVAATRVALDLVSRGRLHPAASPNGVDVWRIGPLDRSDQDVRHQLAAALPAAAYATPLPGAGPLRLPSPLTTVRAFSDAVADVMPRTAAAVTAVGHRAYAAGPATDVEAAASWLASVGAEEHDATVALHLVPPTEPDGAFRAELALQSVHDPSLELSAAAVWDAPEVVMARLGDAETALLVTLRRARGIWAPLGRMLDEARPTGMELADGEVDDLLGPVVDDLAGAGLQVRWPADLFRTVALRPVVSTPSPAAVTGAGLSLDTLAQLHWEAAIGDVALTEAELALLVEAKRSVVRLRGQWVRADPAKLARLTRKEPLTSTEALAVALGGDLLIDGEPVRVEVQGALAGLAERLRAIADGTAGREHPEPAGLEATLRPYQRQGLAWLREMGALGLGGVLADDMGLGKTVQLLAVHLARIGDGDLRPALVVCPTSVVGNWERETARFAPSVPTRRYHGQDRHLTALAPGEIVLATYGVARRDASMLREVEWGLVVADEAQAIKNPLARTAREMRRIPAQARFALTGTPVENRLSELWAILDWTTPGLLGPLERFRTEVAIPVERDRDPVATDALSRLVRPFLLRRRKSDPTIAPDLPPKTETDHVVNLTTEQATLYRAVTEEVLDQIEHAEGIARRGLVLKLLTALKQICNHPAHYLKQSGPLPGRSAKLDATTELLEIIRSEGEASLVFTQYVAMGDLLQAHLGAAGFRTRFLSGRVPMGQREEMVDEFQAGEVDAFVISVKAGGTGLNLTRATHVVHYDRWWNPAVEDQASDRAWRIGQDRPVQVHRPICAGTVEDRISTLLADKRRLAEAVVSGGEAWVSELSNDDLAALVALSADADEPDR